MILGPLAVAMTHGMRGRPTALHLAATLSREGNAIVLANSLANQRKIDETLRTRRQAQRFAAVHAFSNHGLLLRRWLAERGIPPDFSRIVALPPAEMSVALADNRIGGFCVGAPWGAMAVHDGVGQIIATSAAMAPMHPEKFVVVRADFVKANPTVPAALRDALGAATALCQAHGQVERLADLLANPAYLDLPHALLVDGLRSAAGNPVFMVGTDLRPADADLRWTTELMRDAGQFANTNFDTTLAMLR